MEETLIKIGRLNRAFGLKGHIRAFIEPHILARLKKPQAVFIFTNQKPLPYFLDEYETQESGHCMFHFDDVLDKNTADAIVGKEIFVDRKFLKKAKPFESLTDYLGFQLTDEQHGALGTLENIIELPQHELGQFIYKGKEVLFPFNDEVVVKIDKKEKTLHLKLPEGLLEIYL